MRDEIQALVDEMARCFSGGALASMVRPFVLPMPIYLSETDSWMVLRNRRDIAKYMSAKRALLDHRGCCGSMAIAEEVTITPENGGIAARIRWLHLDPQGTPCIETRTTYFFRKDIRGLRIEMAEVESGMKHLTGRCC